MFSGAPSSLVDQASVPSMSPDQRALPAPMVLHSELRRPAPQGLQAAWGGVPESRAVPSWSPSPLRSEQVWCSPIQGSKPEPAASFPGSKGRTGRAAWGAGATLGRCPPASAAVVWAVRGISSRTRDRNLSPGRVPRSAGSLREWRWWDRSRKALEGPGAGAVSVQQQEAATAWTGPVGAFKGQVAGTQEALGRAHSLRGEGGQQERGCTPGMGSTVGLAGPRAGFVHPSPPCSPSCSSTPAPLPAGQPPPRQAILGPRRPFHRCSCKASGFPCLPSAGENPPGSWPVRALGAWPSHATVSKLATHPGTSLCPV